MNKDYNIELNDEDQGSKKESFSFNELDRENREGEPSSRPIHKSMMIAEVVDIYPDVVPVLMENGIHCVGCGASMFETLEEGFMGHGMDYREIDKVVDDLNNYLKQISKGKENTE